MLPQRMLNSFRVATKVCNGEVVSVADGEGCDHQKPDAVDVGHLARYLRVLLAVEGVARVVLHQEHQPRPLQQEAHDLGQKHGASVGVLSTRNNKPLFRQPSL